MLKRQHFKFPLVLVKASAQVFSLFSRFFTQVASVTLKALA